MNYFIETRACLPEFYRDESDKQKKLQVMKDSQFHNLFATTPHNVCNTLIKALIETYDCDTESFRLESRDLCQILEKDVAYLLGIKNTGVVYQEFANAAIPGFYTKWVKDHGLETEPFSKRFLHEAQKKLDTDIFFLKGKIL
ncbi:hypothetical protein POM88_033327 [Heracleum sosnowskyi]|uniref:Uncharacterized protein n=1 Tax=Heracleum sosnowskyi TaxID=360622 RepID=A0AAD8MLT6_9APIA|nr:hypothetical protein POM88_033327 [Heracleum sosnowskyi]